MAVAFKKPILSKSVYYLSKLGKLKHIYLKQVFVSLSKASGVQ